MFGSLLSYEKKDYWESHPTIQLSTSQGQSTYTILAAFYAKVYNQEDSDVFRYYQYTDLTDQNRFNEYAEQVKAAALYDTDIEIQPGDQLLTLSTCSYHTKNGRFVVVACRASSNFTVCGSSTQPFEYPQASCMIEIRRVGMFRQNFLSKRDSHSISPPHHFYSENRKLRYF